MSDWTDQFVGDRMQVDQTFAERVRSSGFTRQQWGTIMTAVEFEIENPDNPETAQLVARTEKVEHVMPAVEEIEQQAMQGAPVESGRSSGGLFDRVADALGFGGNDDTVDQEQLQAAKSLADEYAGAFETHLKDEGKWTEACEVATDSA